jgi:predicted nucleic acid-binding protein
VKIYLDNCCFNRPFDDQSHIKIRLETEAKLYIQNRIREGVYSLCWSYMMDYENTNNPYEIKRNTIAPWKEIASDYCHSSDHILSAGQELMTLGIRTNDALHIACAIEKQCDYFITTDIQLMRKNIKKIRILNPIDFVREMEDIQ